MACSKGKALIALSALAVATLASVTTGADLAAILFSHHPWGSAATVAVLALGALIALRRRTWQSAAWSAGIAGLTYAALCVAYISPRFIVDGRAHQDPLAALVLGAAIALATPLFPVLAWSTLGLACIFDRSEKARCAVPVAALACFALCVLVFPPQGYRH
jgi:hypothetical protein